MLARIIGVFKLDVKVFEEIEHNASLTLPAAIIVAVVALIGGVGGLFSRLVFGGNVLGGFFGAIIYTFFGWIIWSILTWFVGTRFFNGQAEIPEMMRVIGFAFAPQILTIIPCVGPIIGGIWSLIAGFFAIRQGLDLDNTKTFLTIVVGAIGYVILAILLNLIL